MKKEKVVALITAILMTVVISAGCAGNNSEDSQNSSDNTETMQSTYDYSQDDTTASDDDNSADSSVGDKNASESSAAKETDNSDGDNISNPPTENGNDTENVNNTQQSSDSETSQQSSQENSTQQSSQTPLNQQQENSVQTNSTSSGHSPSSPQSQDKPSTQSSNPPSSDNSNGTSGGSAPQTSNPSSTPPSEHHNSQSPSPVDTKTEAEEIYLSTNSVKLKMGETVNLNTTVLPKNAADRSYSYYIDNASVIEYSNGILKGKNPGSATISFKTVNGVTSSCKVEVYGIPSSVKLNKTSIKLDAGDSCTLSAKTNIGNYGISYKWRSTNPDIVSVESTDYSTAVITANTPGTAVVTAETANGVSSVCRITVNPIQNVQPVDYEQYEDEVIRLVNKERTARGLPKLKKRNDLVPLATTRAKEIVSKFDHVRPDGRSSFTILRDNNIQYSYVGENIAYGQDTPEYAMKCWMDSKGHRENILSENFNGIGVGCYEHNGTLYWVQLFIHE